MSMNTYINILGVTAWLSHVVLDKNNIFVLKGGSILCQKKIWVHSPSNCSRIQILGWHRTSTLVYNFCQSIGSELKKFVSYELFPFPVLFIVNLIIFFLHFIPQQTPPPFPETPYHLALYIYPSIFISGRGSESRW